MNKARIQASRKVQPQKSGPSILDENEVPQGIDKSLVNLFDSTDDEEEGIDSDEDAEARVRELRG